IAATMLFAAPAHAADTTVTFNLQNGALSIAVASPGSVALGNKTPTGALAQFTGSLLATTVTDSRNSNLGWTAYSFSTDFTNATYATSNAAADKITKANINVSVSAADSLTVGGISKIATSGLFVPTVGGANGDATHGSSVAGG